MVYPSDVKILVFLLGYLAACSGIHMKAPNLGYNYNRGQDTNSLNNILKAVLAHESTGHGLHSGSISSPSRSIGVDLRGSKQTRQKASSGYSYSANQQMRAKLGAADITTIRVFHESTGNTGNIMRNYRPLYEQKSSGNTPRGFSNSPADISESNPAHTLKYIHETALARSRSDQLNGARRQGQPSSEPIAFSTKSGSTGYLYESSEQPRNADNFYGTPRQADSREIIMNSGSAANGYQYSHPIQAINRGLVNENLRNAGTNSLQAEFPILDQTQNVNLRNIVSGSIQASSNGYQYPNQGGSNGYQYQSPIQTPNRALSNDNLRNTPSSLGLSQNVNLQSTGSGSDQSNSNGYKYTSQGQNLNGGYSSSSLGQSQNVNLQSTGSGSDQSNSNGYKYTRQGQDLNGGYNSENLRNPSSESFQSENSERITNNGYRYENPRSKGYPNDNQGVVTNSETEQIAISQYVSSTQLNSANQGYRYDNSGIVQNVGVQDANQYANQFAKGDYRNENPRTDGYQYQNPNEQVGYQLSQSVHNKFAGPMQVNEATHHFEQPGQSTSSRYHFDGPRQSLGLNFNSKETIYSGYRYDKPEQPDSAKSVFKGQPYLPLPLIAKDSGYQYESPKSTQSDGYRYDKPEQSSRPQTTFKGQPYLPLPPVSGAW